MTAAPLSTHWSQGVPLDRYLPGEDGSAAEPQPGTLLANAGAGRVLSLPATSRHYSDTATSWPAAVGERLSAILNHFGIYVEVWSETEEHLFVDMVYGDDAGRGDTAAGDRFQALSADALEYYLSQRQVAEGILDQLWETMGHRRVYALVLLVVAVLNITAIALARQSLSQHQRCARCGYDAELEAPGRAHSERLPATSNGVAVDEKGRLV